MCVCVCVCVCVCAICVCMCVHARAGVYGGRSGDDGGNFLKAILRREYMVY
jgi:hypothetical protein